MNEILTKGKESPILFSTPMVQAILSGRKTQTRRVLKPGRGYQESWLSQEVLNRSPKADFRGKGVQMEHPGGGPLTFIYNPYGQIGDRLWVRETWNTDGGGTYDYKADFTGNSLKDLAEMPPEWKPSIHMPRRACRLILEITDVRVERLQDISDSDACNEGIESAFAPADGSLYKNYIVNEYWPITPRQSFASLWHSINGKKYPRELNPWLWVISFKTLTPKPEQP